MAWGLKATATFSVSSHLRLLFKLRFSCRLSKQPFPLEALRSLTERRPQQRRGVLAGVDAVPAGRARREQPPLAAARAERSVRPERVRGPTRRERTFRGAVHERALARARWRSARGTRGRPLREIPVAERNARVPSGASPGVGRISLSSAFGDPPDRRGSGNLWDVLPDAPEQASEFARRIAFCSSSSRELHLSPSQVLAPPKRAPPKTFKSRVLHVARWPRTERPAS